MRQIVPNGERERERVRQTDRQRKRERERQTDKQRKNDSQTDRDRQTKGVSFTSPASLHVNSFTSISLNHRQMPDIYIYTHVLSMALWLIGRCVTVCFGVNVSRLLCT